MSELTPAEAAQRLGTERDAILRLAWKGRLSSVMTPTGRRLSSTETERLAAFLDAARHSTGGGRRG